MHEPYILVDSHEENDRTKSLTFDRHLVAQPGQFVMAWLPGVGEKPFSISNDDRLALMVVSVGPFSAALHRLRPGDRVWIRGPLGRGFHLPESGSARRLLLVGGGYGVAPLRFLARTALAAGHEVEICIGARTATDLLLADVFEREGCAVQLTTEDGSCGRQGLVTGAVEDAVRRRPPDAVYACGPVPMLEAVEAVCGAHRLPHQLSWEARMRCGMGLCGACEVEGRGRLGWLACTDGPVSAETHK